MMRKTTVAAVVLLSCLTVSSPARGYAGDSHYYLRFATALEACFDWDEAHLIASADYLVDKNRTTTAEKHPFKKHNKINWHAFGGSEERFNELWERVLNEKDEEYQLVKLGQFLHFISDWESHYGYGVRLGHGIPTFVGKDPDSLGANRMNNLRMIDQTIDHMVEICLARGRHMGRGEEADLFRANLYKDLAYESLLEDMFLYNTRKWKTWAVRGKKGKEILARNHFLIEQLIDRRRHKTPGRGVPEDFRPGDAQNGIPAPLGIRYDSSGELVEIYGAEIELMPEFQGPDTFGTNMDAAAEELLEESQEPEFLDELEQELQDGEDLDLYANLELLVLDTSLVDDGWMVKVAVENLGLGESGSGILDVLVIDIVSEELLGEVSRPVNAMNGGERTEFSLLVPSEEKPGKKILVGASLKVPSELSADNNDAWYVPWREGIRSSKKKKKLGKERGDINLLNQPRLWMDETEPAAWMVLTALTSGGRSSRRLTRLTASLLNETGSTPLSLNDERFEAIWMSIPDLKRRVVPAETLSWFRLNTDLCSALHDGGAPTSIRIAISGDDVAPFQRTYPLQDNFTANLMQACTSIAPKQ